jgi:hypothetical protein
MYIARWMGESYYQIVDVAANRVVIEIYDAELAGRLVNALNNNEAKIVAHEEED